MGNIGNKYVKTRHNIGFKVVESFVSDKFTNFQNICVYNRKDKYIVMKPSLFMNNSGIAIKKFTDYFRIKVDDILVVYDDIDLEFGTIRFRENGSSGGHLGIQSIIELLQTSEIKRLRFGILPSNLCRRETKDFVLSNFNNEESNEIPELIIRCKRALKSFINNDSFKNIMSNFNRNYLKQS